jgi:DbpA RNA binding domain
VAGLVRDHLGARPTAGEQAAAARRAAPPRVVRSAGGDPPAPKTGRFPDRKVPVLPTPPRERLPDRPVPEPKPEKPDAAASPGGSSEPPTQPKPRREMQERAEVEGPTVPPAVPRRGERPPRTERGAKASREAPEQSNGRPGRSEGGAELFVSVGRKDGARASDFYAVLEQRAGITIDDTEYVNVRQRHTFIGLPKGLVARALEALNGAVIAGREATAEPSRSSQ